MIDGSAPGPPMASLFDFRPTRVSDGVVEFVATPGEQHYNPIGSVHGGFFSTILDTAVGCAVVSTLPKGLGFTTIDLHVHIVRPLFADSGQVTAVGTVVHRGRKVMTAEGKLFDARGRLCAHATTTCLIVPWGPR
jgi:uncharacterized protein (TIGR00369 family)